MAEMTPEKRVKIVVDIVAEEILRQMREMQAAAQDSGSQKKFPSFQKSFVSKLTIEAARGTMKRLELCPDRWGHYTVGEYRLIFSKDAIRIERRYKYDSGERGSIQVRSLFYNKLDADQLERIINLLKKNEAG